MDHFGGTYDVQASVTTGVSADNDDDAWVSLGKFTRKDAGAYYFKFGFPMFVQLKAVRIVVSDVTASIDELEIYGAPRLTQVKRAYFDDLFMLDIGSSSTGAVPFASGSDSMFCSDSAAGEGTDYGRGSRCLNNINDGQVGERSAWMPGIGSVDGKKFVGIRFHGTLMIHGFGLSSDEGGVGTCSEGFDGTHIIQATTDDSYAGAATVNEAWDTLGTFERNTGKAYYYKFAVPIQARAMRIVVPSDETCIDEITVYGKAFSLYEELW